MEELGDQLIHASEQVRRLRADHGAEGGSARLVEAVARREALLDSLFARMHGIDQPV